MERDLNRFVSFLNALPATNDMEEWLLTFRDALRELLGDVDRIGLNINVACDLTESRECEEFTLFFMQAFAPEGDGSPEVVVGACAVDRQQHERLVDVAYRYLPKQEYHPVHGIDYTFNGAYLGSILLWRARGKAPISAGTLRLMTALRPFIEFVFTDAVARFRYLRPGGRTLQRITAIIRRDAGLTDREWEVLHLHMSGMTYKEIADCLSLSLVAVKKRMIQIHRKAGVENQFELFARYCTERIFEPAPEYGALRM